MSYRSQLQWEWKIRRLHEVIAEEVKDLVDTWQGNLGEFDFERGETIDLLTFLKSTQDLVNEHNTLEPTGCVEEPDQQNEFGGYD